MRKLKITNSFLVSAQWKQVWRVDNLTELYVGDCHLTDGDLQGIEQLENLQSLTLENVPISDEAMSRIARLPRLRELSLLLNEYTFAGPFISDEGLAALGQMPTLEGLTIVNQSITGAAFEKWKHANQLLTLTLTNSEVTDERVANLEKFKNLYLLDLRGSHVTKAAVDVLASNSKLRLRPGPTYTYAGNFADPFGKQPEFQPVFVREQ